jgi:ammonium transporter, Amt family
MTPNGLLQIWWLVAAMLVFMMQVGFLLLETGLIQERHQAGIAVKSMMMLLASSTAYTLVGHHYVWGNSNPPLNTQEWQFYQTGFAAVAATILSGSMAGRTTLVSNVIMAALVGAVFFPLHARLVWGGGFLSTAPYHVHDFAGSGSVHLLGGLIALAGSVAAGPRREKRDIAPGAPMHISPRSLPVAACGVIFLWIGWMGFNGGSIQSADKLNTIGRLVISTCLAASAGGFAVCGLAGIRRLKDSHGYVYAPYATLSGIMAGMVANSASCDLITASVSTLNLSMLVGSVAGIFAYGANWVLQQFFHVDDPVEAIAVHAGGGVVGLIFAGLYQSPISLSPQLLDIAVLVSITLLPSWIIFKVIDLLGRFPIHGRTPLRLKSTADEENLGLTFDDPTTRVGLPPVHFHYLPDDLKTQLYDYLNLLTSMPIHVARGLYKSAGELIGAMKGFLSGESNRAPDLSKLDGLYDELRQRIESIPDVLRRLQTGIGEPVPLDPLVQSIANEYRERYPKVEVTFAASASTTYINGDRNLTREAIRMVVSNSMTACMQRLDRMGTPYAPDDYRPEVWLVIDSETSRPDGQVFLYVRDNGVGIDADVRHYLGQPFAGFNKAGRGSGLGLFFASWITMQFGGRLDCTKARDPNDSTSTAGDQTEFLMRFRMERSAESLTRSAQQGSE